MPLYLQMVTLVQIYLSFRIDILFMKNLRLINCFEGITGDFAFLNYRLNFNYFCKFQLSFHLKQSLAAFNFDLASHSIACSEQSHN